MSGRQFRQSRLPEIVADVLAKTGLEAKFLELELTESLLVDDIEHAVETMYQLKDMGTSLVIDDFGTGYSSLSYLKQFPVNKLKIDRSFISELSNQENDAAIARAIINLGHSLNLEVLAEGVETELQKDFMVAHGCDYAQGYYFKPPNTAAALKDYLENFPGF
nr:EAL domain-containing protein [Legionella donaldsonii]